MAPTIKDNLTWSSISQVATAFFGLLGSIIISRCLGPEARGIYILVITTGTVISSIFGSDSLQAALIYVNGKNIAIAEKVSTQTIWFVIITGVVSSLILYLIPITILQKLIPSIIQEMLWVIILYSVALAYLSYIYGILTGKNEIRILSKVILLDIFVGFSLQIIFLVFLDLGLQGALWQLVGVSVVRLLIGIKVLSGKYQIVNFPNLNIIKTLAAYSIKIYPSSIGVMFITRIDYYLLAALSGPSAVGIYSLAKGLAQMIDIFEYPISRAIAPSVVSENQEQASRVISKTLRLTILLSTVVASIAAISSPWLIPLVYGEEFSGAVIPFVILLIGMIIGTTRMLNNFFSLQIGKPEYQTIITLVEAMVCIPIFYVLTKIWGSMGTATANTIVLTFRSIMSVTLFLKLTKLPLRSLLVNNTDIRQVLSSVFKQTS